jgi:Transglutaminase-like superfamily
LHSNIVVVERPDATSWLLHLNGRTLRVESPSTRLLDAIAEPAGARAIREIVQRFGAKSSPRNGGIVIPAALSVAECFTHPRRRAWATLLVARAALALFGWAATSHAWERRYPQPVVKVQDALALDAIDETARSLHHDSRARALTFLALARSSGFEADLVIGLTYAPLAAHVWVECDSRVLGEPSQ